MRMVVPFVEMRNIRSKFERENQKLALEHNKFEILAFQLRRLGVTDWSSESNGGIN